MNLEWEQNWLQLFDNRLEGLLSNYPEEFEYEDLNLGVRIVDDKEELRRLFRTFENADPEASRREFNATCYHGDENGGCLERTWEIKHKTDFLGLPATGKTTKVCGFTIHKFRAGKIILERSLWDTAALMRQLGHPGVCGDGVLYRRAHDWRHGPLRRHPRLGYPAGPYFARTIGSRRVRRPMRVPSNHESGAVI